MVIKFNSAGHALINKQTGLAMTSEVRQELKQLRGIKFPQRVTSYDVVEIGHNFNPEESNTHIITFRDKNGKIVQQNVREKCSDGTFETQRNYKELEETSVTDPDFESFADDPDFDFEGHLINVNGRKISTVVKREGKIYSKSEEIQTKAVKPDGEPVVNISKIESVPFGFDRLEQESQSMYEYSRDGKKGYKIQNYGKAHDMGAIITPDDETFVFENMPDLRHDKYLPLHLYSLKHFKRMAPYVAKHPDHIIRPNYEVKWFSEPNNKGRTRYGYYDGDIHLNRQANKNRFDVIKTSAHEKEHAYQAQVMRDKPDSEEGIEYFNAKIDSIIAGKTKDFAKYKVNLLEQKAREAGRLAKNQYSQSADNLKRQFPYAPDYQVGYSFRDQDAECGWGSIFDSLNIDY